MAFSVTYGVKKGKELNIDIKNSKKMNYTDYIKQICDKYFIEEIFMEDDEEIPHYIMGYKSILEVYKLLNDIEIKQKETCLVAKGTEKKNELISEIHDYFLLQSIIIEAITTEISSDNLVLTLV